MNDQILLLTAVLLTSLMGIVIAFIALSYRQLVKRYDKLHGEVEAQKHAADVFAQQELAAAQKKATAIIADAESYSNKLKAEFSEHLKVLLAKEATHHQSLVHTLQEEYVKVFQSNSQEIKKAGETLIAQLAQDVMNQAKTAAEAFQKDAAAKRAEIEKEWIAELDTKASAIIEAATVSVMGKALSVKDHEDLIFKALDEAKKNHVF